MLLRHLAQAKALEQEKLAATPKKQGVGAKIAKSLSFSRRKKLAPIKPNMPDDIVPDDLISARGNGPDRGTTLLGMPKQDENAIPSGEVPTGGKSQKRSLSFLRRKKAADAVEAQPQKV